MTKDSRDATTFLHNEWVVSLCKCLGFRIIDAPEKSQHIIRQVLASCEGVLNIADDSIVHGRDSAEYDLHLSSVLLCLQERGLTLNTERVFSTCKKYNLCMGFLDALLWKTSMTFSGFLNCIYRTTTCLVAIETENGYRVPTPHSDK